MRSITSVFVFAAIATLTGSAMAVVATGTQTRTSVDVEMEIYGGFAFLREAGPKINVAYLRNTNTSTCDVLQLGTYLYVRNGEIIEPASHVGRLFDLAGTVLTFADLPSTSGVLDATRGPRPNGGPADPANNGHWHPLHWIAGFTLGPKPPFPPTDFPKSNRRSDWRERVDGHFEITAGKLHALHPSDPDLRKALFEFKTSPSATPKFTQAMTDRVSYTATIASDRVRIARRTQLGSPMTPIVIQPTGSAPIRLKLFGVHSHAVPPLLKNGQVLPHYCAFYDLMTPEPPHAQQLLPYATGLPAVTPASTTTTVIGVGQPSPGAYCPGIWM